MRRRKAVKAIALSTITPSFLLRNANAGSKSFVGDADQPKEHKSSWHQWPDMLWIGPEYWGNRLQDWEIRGGKAVCVVSDQDRNLHSLICQLSSNPSSFQTSVTIDLLNRQSSTAEADQIGFVLGAKGRFEDYRSAAVFGEGLRTGVNGEGRLFIGDAVGEKIAGTLAGITLHITVAPVGDKYRIRLAARNGSRQEVAEALVAEDISAEAVEGNIALLSHFPSAENSKDKPSVAFSDWNISGEKVRWGADQVFGPVCFAQYTLHHAILKLTAQLAPIETIGGHKVVLQIREGKKWRTVREGKIDPLGRSVHFRIEQWNHYIDVPYRVRVALPLKDGVRTFDYEGTIAREPVDNRQVKMAVFSCNGDHGFPDADVPLHVSKHKPDLAVFLGDQFYESTGGFGIQTSPIEKSSLDYLRKWYMFGWSYRDIFRHIPSACIPDDHDVYHGNVWGEGGKNAPTDQGWAYAAQDQGGYKMPAEWVNMVQRTQTSHLPDPYDPTPVKQGIGVYYTSWNYAGISMAILEDRKFKSAPRQALPPEAKVVNGFIQNRDFDIKAHYDVDAELLGDRQLKFLNDWATDWEDGSEMKAVLSQTNFCTVATLPEGSIIDSGVPRLPIPEPGAYVQGDAPTTDMDSNGWPQKGRDEALRIIRKCFALHIAGDQHLASMVKYGIDEFGDAGYAFAGPALNNIFPRRWWPPVGEDHKPIPGQPAYTGNFEDGFGNKMTVMAVANPRKTNRKPAIIYDRSTGYGIVTFDKQNRTMKIECWPRYADPERDANGQYEGWPVTVTQEDNYGRKQAGYLPTLQIRGANDPVVVVIDEEHGDVVYSLRIKGNTFRPRIFSSASHTIKVIAGHKQKTIKNITPAQHENQTLRIDIG